MKTVKTLILAAMVALCGGVAVAASGPVITTRDTVVTIDGKQWTHTITDGVSYFKINYEDGPVFLDRSFTLCWPEKLGKYKLDGLRAAILDKLSAIRVPALQEREPLTSYDAAVADYASVGDADLPAVERVEVLPDDSDREEMNFFNTTIMSVERMAPRYVGYSFVQDAYLGGVVNHGVNFLNYDLKSDRVLGIDDILEPGAIAVVIDKLKDLELWDELWDEFRAAPYLSKNFFIDSNSLVMVYNRYEITYGAMGTVVLVLPYDKLKPYLKPIVKELF